MVSATGGELWEKDMVPFPVCLLFCRSFFESTSEEQTALSGVSSPHTSRISANLLLSNGSFQPRSLLMGDEYSLMALYLLLLLKFSADS